MEIHSPLLSKEGVYRKKIQSRKARYETRRRRQGAPASPGAFGSRRRRHRPHVGACNKLKVWYQTLLEGLAV